MKTHTFHPHFLDILVLYIIFVFRTLRCQSWIDEGCLLTFVAFQCCLFVSALSTHVPSCLSATSLFELDLVFVIDRASPTCARVPGLASHEGSKLNIAVNVPAQTSCPIARIPTQKQRRESFSQPSSPKVLRCMSRPCGLRLRLRARKADQL